MVRRHAHIQMRILNWDDAKQLWVILFSLPLTGSHAGDKAESGKV